jgi:hypothetical protein
MNYKVNDVVAQLIADDPNIVKKAENVLEWEVWNEWKDKENALPLPSENTTEGKGSRESAKISEEVQENEIIYFD